MIIDANGIVLGRLASFAAKKALLGEDVVVVNAEKALVSGGAGDIYKRHRKKLDIKNKGNRLAGPFHQKRPDKFVRRVIRGMLPYKRERGRDAFKRVMVYVGVPAGELARRHGVNAADAKYESVGHLKKHVESYLTVNEVCTMMGGERWKAQ